MATSLVSPMAASRDLNLRGLFGVAVAVQTRQPTLIAMPRRPVEIVAKKSIQGVVVSNSRDKTVAVEVKRIAPHPLYKKRIVKSKKYHAHDPENKCNIGDFVTLANCAPVSKTKKFLVVEIRPPKVAGSNRHTGDTDSEAEDEGVLPPLESEVAAV